MEYKIKPTFKIILLILSIISIGLVVSQVYAFNKENQTSKETIIETKKIKIPSDDSFFQAKINQLDQELYEIEKNQPLLANQFFENQINRKILNETTIDLIAEKEKLKNKSILNQTFDIFYPINVYKAYYIDNQNLERINNKINETYKAIQDLDQQDKTINDKLNEISNKRKEKEELMKELNKNENKIIEIDKEMDENINNIKNDTIDKSIDNNTFFNSNSFIFPAKGSLTSDFGYRIHPISKQRIFHSGIDIGVDYGDTIIASNTGLVVFSGSYGGFGNSIIISHGNKNYSLYAHNSQLLVEKGDLVNQGQPVALGGSTGYSTGPHCHFSLWINDELVNPIEYIK